MAENVGWILLGLAGLIAAANLYFSCLRFGLYRMLGWEYCFVSGMPVAGTLLLAIAIVCLWRVPTAWYSAGVVAMLDTGGLPWFAVVMLWRASSWSRHG